MKTTLKTVLALILVVTFAACNNSQPKEDSHEGHNHGTTAEVKQTSAVNLKDDKLNAVYLPYQHLTAALTEGDAAAARVAALALEAGAKEVQGGEALAKTAAQLLKSNDLEAQRVVYSPLSNEFIALLKKTGLDSGELYVAHCPMALNDKGAQWVSHTKEIRNPYFGDSMLTCGSVTETLN